MFGKNMIAAAVASNVYTVMACGSGQCSGHHGEDDADMGMPGMDFDMENFDMGNLQKMFAQILGDDFDMSQFGDLEGMLGGLEGMGGDDSKKMNFAEDSDESEADNMTTCPSPSVCDNKCDSMDMSSDSCDEGFTVDEGFSPAMTFAQETSPAQIANNMTMCKSYARTPAQGFTSMEEGCTPFEGFTCACCDDVTPKDAKRPMGEGFTAAPESMDSMDDSNDEPAQCCGNGSGMCGLEMCGAQAPVQANNSTAADDMCCNAGMCGMEAPKNTTTAEDMFNNTDTCNGDFMCQMQQNITNMFNFGNDTDVETDNLDSSDSEL